MESVRTRQAKLLREAAARQSSASKETSAFNLLSALGLESYETRVHSKIILFLLKEADGQGVFLRRFLLVLGIPPEFLEEEWNVFRERAFDGGRMDFVLESRSYCAIIEMKLDAEDGESQLARYASFGRMRGKQYCVYYLTPDGHAPTEQSVKGMDSENVMCISFREELVLWLQSCMEAVEEGSYPHAFLKQYLGAVRCICGMDDGEAGVKDLLNSSKMARAAQLVADSFYEKMDEVTAQFFQKLGAAIGNCCGRGAYTGYTNAVYVRIDSIIKKQSYSFTLGIEYDPYLYVCFGFSEETKDGGLCYLTLADAERLFPKFYKTWMNRLDRLENLPKLRQAKRSRWFYLEDACGARMNFCDYSAQIALIDEMELQIRFVCDSIVGQIIEPLLAG